MVTTIHEAESPIPSMKEHSLPVNTARCVPKIVSFIRRLHQLQHVHKYSDKSMYAMDETACWFDMSGETTVALAGSRTVPVKTTGHEKSHLTVILMARADGKN